MKETSQIPMNRKSAHPYSRRMKATVLAIIIILFGVGYCYYNTEDNKSARAEKEVEYIVRYDSYTPDELYYLSEAFRHLGEKYKAFHMLKRAAQAGSNHAEFWLGRYYLSDENEDLEQAMIWLTKAAEKGNPEYQYFAAHCYEQLDMKREKENWDERYRIAAKYYLSAAMQGHAEAMNGIARCYSRGRGIEKDVHAAEKWYLQAKELGECDDLGLALLYIYNDIYL